jgi:hypothetical protein
MKPAEPVPVMLLSGILYVRDKHLDRALRLLEARFGPVNYRSEAFAFTVTDYYVKEMGGPIQRIFVSFERLVDPSALPEIKLETMALESSTALPAGRSVNLDPGYMDFNKVVLASVKYNGQKIYLGRGIYADPTLYYEKGKFRSYPWSFPDFRERAYEAVFLKIRERYKAALKKRSGAHFGR